MNFAGLVTYPVVADKYLIGQLPHYLKYVQCQINYGITQIPRFMYAVQFHRIQIQVAWMPFTWIYVSSAFLVSENQN
jgi:hypothetical protein